MAQLRDLRLNAHMTQAELGRRVGRTPDAVGLWERGVRTPPYKILRKLERVFNVPAGSIQFPCDEEAATSELSA